MEQLPVLRERPGDRERRLQRALRAQAQPRQAGPVARPWRKLQRLWRVRSARGACLWCARGLGAEQRRQRRGAVSSWRVRTGGGEYEHLPTSSVILANAGIQRGERQRLRRPRPCRGGNIGDRSASGERPGQLERGDLLLADRRLRGSGAGRPRSRDRPVARRPSTSGKAARRSPSATASTCFSGTPTSRAGATPKPASPKPTSSSDLSFSGPSTPSTLMPGGNAPWPGQGPSDPHRRRWRVARLLLAVGGVVWPPAFRRRFVSLARRPPHACRRAIEWSRPRLLLDPARDCRCHSLDL